MRESDCSESSRRSAFASRHAARCASRANRGVPSCGEPSRRRSESGLELPSSHSSDSWSSRPRARRPSRRPSQVQNPGGSPMGIVLNFVKDYERIARFRFGRFEGMKGPGIVIAIPVVHAKVPVDTRTEVLDVPRQTNITVAEGEKQAAILRAEGEKQAAILRAEGFKEALIRIFEAARGVDEKTMTLQYLDTLKALGASPSSKFVFPLEFTRLLEGLRVPAGGDGSDRDKPPPKRRGVPFGRRAPRSSSLC